MGNLGAYISHLFFYKGFGVASYLVCSFFFIIGANLIFKKKIFSIGRNLRYVIVGLLYFSLAFSYFFFQGKCLSLGWGSRRYAG